MNRFKQFNIKTPAKGFEGDKIKIAKIINREIIVHDFKIEPSKCFKEIGSGKCLQLQISINNEKHIVFTSSTGLIEAIKQITKDKFPFLTTIIEENDRFIFS
jgi:hypothetical protein